MHSVVVFGGTTEGRKLCEACASAAIPIVYCVATADGARAVAALPYVEVRVGRLEAGEMVALLELQKPALVVDATHPYALEVSRNIEVACRDAGISMLRVTRDNIEEQDCVYFHSMDDMLAWIAQEQGNVFVTMGSSVARAFTRLPDYQNRVWMRILPSMDSLRICLDLGYPPERLICMQGPFSETLNRAMLQAANAGILVTKASGAAGGFPEKVRAAQSLGIITAVWTKPKEPGGVSLEEACKRMMELRV